MPTNAEGWPAGQPSAAFGDVMGGLATAGAIAAALLQRERTGEPTVVDVSLLATAMWQLSPMVVAAKLFGLTRLPTANRLKNPNPGVNTYRTADHRFISLVLLQADKFWDDLAKRLERPELTTDERFSTSAARAQNSEACVAVLDEAFGSRPLAHWKEALADFAGVWTPYQTLDELYRDPQVIANGYLPAMEAPRTAGPARRQPRPVRRTPGGGEPGPRARRAHRTGTARRRVRLGRDRRHEEVRRDPVAAASSGIDLRCHWRTACANVVSNYCVTFVGGPSGRHRGEGNDSTCVPLPRPLRSGPTLRRNALRPQPGLGSVRELRRR